MITYVDYTIEEAIRQYKTLLFDYPFGYYILGAIIVFSLIILINLNTRNAFIITFITWIISIISIFLFRGIDMIGNIDTIINSHFYQNIFFYYWNVIVGMLILHISLNNKNSNITKYILLIFYILTVTNLIYSFYITNIVNNNYILVVGNISPIVILGNILLFIMYLYLIILKIVEACKKKR